MLLLLSASPKVLGDVLYPPVEDFLLVQAIGLPLEVVLEIFVPLVLVAATEGEVVLAALPKQVLALLVEGTEPLVEAEVAAIAVGLIVCLVEAEVAATVVGVSVPLVEIAALVVEAEIVVLPVLAIVVVAAVAATVVQVAAVLAEAVEAATVVEAE